MTFKFIVRTAINIDITLESIMNLTDKAVNCKLQVRYEDCQMNLAASEYANDHGFFSINSDIFAILIYVKLILSYLTE